MRRAVCLICDTRQTSDQFKSCKQCDGKLQRQILCPWCVSWSPDTNKCVRCDLDLTFEAPYACMRTLVAAGVDKMSLAFRAASLSPEEKELQQKHFAEQLKTIEEKSAVYGFLEKHLIGKDYRLRYIDAQVSYLPLTRDQAARYTAVTIPKLTGDTNTVLQAIRNCTFDDCVPELAKLALLRRWVIDDELVKGWVHLTYHPTYEKEALALLGHPLSQQCSFNFRGNSWESEFVSKARALFSNPIYAPWVALAFFRFASHHGQDLSEEEWTKIQKRAERLVESGLKSKDQDLAFSCALALGDVGKLLPYVKKGNQYQKEFALDVVSVSGEKRTLPLFQKNPRRVSLLYSKGHQMAPQLLKVLLESYKKTDEESRRAVSQLRHLGKYTDFPKASRQIIKKWFQGKGGALLAWDERLQIFEWIVSDKKNSDVKSCLQALGRQFSQLKAKELPRVLELRGVEAWLLRARSPQDLKMVVGWLLHKSPEVAKKAMELMTRIPEQAGNWLPKGAWLRRPYFEALLKNAKDQERSELTVRWMEQGGYLSDEMLKTLSQVYLKRVQDRDRLYAVFHDQRTRIENTMKGFEHGLPPGPDVVKSLRIWMATEKYNVEKHVLRAWKASPPAKLRTLAKALPSVLLSRESDSDPWFTNIGVYEELLKMLPAKALPPLRLVDESWTLMKRELEKLKPGDYPTSSAQRVEDALAEKLPERKKAREKNEKQAAEEKSLHAKIKASAREQVTASWDRYGLVIKKVQKVMADAGADLQREHTKIVTSDISTQKRTEIVLKLQEKFQTYVKKHGEAISRSGDEVKAIVTLFEREIEQILLSGVSVKELLKKTHVIFSELKKRMDNWEKKLLKTA